MKAYDLGAFGHIGSAKELVTSKLTLDALPPVESVLALAKWTGDMLSLYDVTREQAQAPAPADGQKPFDRSGALTRMAYYGAECGWDDAQIMAILVDLDDRWEKYSGRRDRERHYLVPILNRARQKHGYTPLIDIDMSTLGKGSASADDGVTVYGAQDFVDAEFKIDWTLDQLLAQGGIGLMVGYAGTGKTQACLQMAAHMALGIPRYLKWDNLGGKKKVLFLSLEMGKAPFHHFMELIVQSYDDRRTLNRNLLIAPLGVPIALDQPEGQAFLNNLLDEYKPDVIFIDSLQKVVSKELTDELAVKSIFHYLSGVRKKHRCSMVIIHHNRKRGSIQQKKNEVELSDVYGSTYITTDVDFVLSLRMDSPNVLTMDMLKNRLGKTMEPFEMVRDDKLAFLVDLENVTQMFGHDNDKDRYSAGFGL